jgi:hypothetical protein
VCIQCWCEEKKKNLETRVFVLAQQTHEYSRLPLKGLIEAEQSI